MTKPTAQETIHPVDLEGLFTSLYNMYVSFGHIMGELEEIQLYHDPHDQFARWGDWDESETEGEICFLLGLVAVDANRKDWLDNIGFDTSGFDYEREKLEARLNADRQ